jgi:hypothetical protein
LAARTLLVHRREHDIRALYELIQRGAEVFAARGPLLLELGKRRRVDYCTARLELMDVNAYQLRCLVLQH